MDKSFLKWAGGKSKLLPVILNEIKEVNGTYIEPFLGSGVVAFNVYAQRYLLSDINADLINVFQQLKSGGDFLLLTVLFFLKKNLEMKLRFTK